MHDTHIYIYILCNICIYYYYYYYLMFVVCRKASTHIYICSYNKDYYYSYYDLYIDSYSKFVMQSIYIPLLILIHL